MIAIRNEDRPLRVLVLTQHFWPEQFRINSFVEQLENAGANISVLTGQPNYPSGKVFEGYRANRAQIERHPFGYEIFRVPLFPRGNGGGARLFLNYVSFLLAASTVGALLLRRRSFDVIFVYGTSPIFQAFAALVLRRLKRAPVALWVQDLWPHVLVSTGFTTNRRVLTWIEHAVSSLYRRVDLILAQSEAFVDVIRPLAGAVPVKYFPNPGDHPIFDQSPTVKKGDDFSVVFAGNLGRAQALETVVHAAKILQSDPTVRITLYGSGAMERWIREQIRSQGLSNIILGGRVPSNSMPGIYARASAALLTLADDDMISRTIPSKLQSYLGAGIPIVAAAGGEAARVVREAGAGIVCKPGDSLALANAILELRRRSPEDLALMRRNARAYYDAEYEPRALADSLISQLRQLVAARIIRGK